MYGNYAPGPQRQRARAHYLGFTVGPLVRAMVMTKTPPGPQRELVPLDFGTRLSNYHLQVSVRDHCISGKAWQPTARQYRRLDHKARHAAAPFGPKNRPAEIQGRRANVVILDDPHPVAAWNEPARLGVAPPVMQQNPPERGFRVVDRRGEHR